jgi:hypothetical protein
MPCPIQIKSELISLVDDLSSSGERLSLKEAKKVAKTVNNKFGFNVVDFIQVADFIDKSITIPNALVQIYYNNELQIEQEELAKFEEEKEKIPTKPTDDELSEQLRLEQDEREEYTSYFDNIEEQDNTEYINEESKTEDIEEEEIVDKETKFDNNGQGVLFQNQSQEGIIASEKTIRDLAAKMSDRIGIPYKIISDRTQQFKGKIENNVAYINLAYATLDTPIHEILAHPIIRAIKNRGKVYADVKVVKTFNNQYQVRGTNKEGVTELILSENFNTEEEAKKFADNVNYQINPQLYQNLLKELETGRGKEVLDRIKRDYKFKKEIPDFFIEKDTRYFKEFNKYYLSSYKTGEDKTISKEEYENNYNEGKYTLEEHQEEAIVELLGLMTAEKLDDVKDGKLISLLKRLLKEMKQFIRSLINQKEVEIDKLPDNMTIGDLADLLAYSNSKLILPGYEVEYTTPDNMKFKTYQEASNHISQLAKSVEDVDLESVKITSNGSLIESLDLKNEYFELYDNLYKTDSLKGQELSHYLDLKNNNSKFYGNAKDYDSLKFAVTNTGNYYQLHPEDNSASRITKERFDKYIQQVGNTIKSFIEKNKEYEQSKEIIEEWKKVNNIQYNPEEIYSRGQEFVSVVGAYSSFDVNLMMQNLLQHIEDNQKAGGKFAISAYTKPIDRQIGHLEGGGGKIKFKLYPQSKDILWAANTDVYSGSVWDASEKVNKDKKSELLGVSYTKYPSLNNVNVVQPNLAAIVDDLAHHHNELGITLTGNNFRLEYDENIPYQTKKIIDGVNKILDQKYGKLVKPEISKYSQKLTNEEVLRTADFSNSEMDEQEALDYLKKAPIGRTVPLKNNKRYIQGEEGDRYLLEDDSSNSVIKLGEDSWSIQNNIQPTQTKDNLKESIESVKNKLKTFSDYYQIDFDGNNWVILGQENEFVGLWENKKDAEKELNKIQPKKSQKEYTSQALINTKIAALKEVAKKYPRSLIRNEVRKSNTSSSQELYDQFGADELPFQKVPLVENNKILSKISQGYGEEISINDWNLLSLEEQEYLKRCYGK